MHHCAAQPATAHQPRPMTGHQHGGMNMTAHQHDPVWHTGQTQECTMNAPLNLFDNQVAARFSRHIVSAGRVLADSTLPAATQELVKISPQPASSTPTAMTARRSGSPGRARHRARRCPRPGLDLISRRRASRLPAHCRADRLSGQAWTWPWVLTAEPILRWVAVPVGIAWAAFLCWRSTQLAQHRLESRSPENFAHLRRSRERVGVRRPG